MVAKRFELLHLTIPENPSLLVEKNRTILESGALDRSAKQPWDIFRDIVSKSYDLY